MSDDCLQGEGVLTKVSSDSQQGGVKKCQICCQLIYGSPLEGVPYYTLKDEGCLVRKCKIERG